MADLIDEMSRDKKRRLEIALQIAQEGAKEADSLAWMANVLARVSIPYRAPKSNSFTRRNGALELNVSAPTPGIGLPYGSIPRMILVWVATTAIRNKTRHLHLGNTMAAFMTELGYGSSGGKKGTIHRFKDQIDRTFHAAFSMNYVEPGHGSTTNMYIADKTDYWWDAKSPDQIGLWRSEIVLSESFYNHLIDAPVPVDLRALTALRSSPLALDIYAWLTYRMFALPRRTTIPWEYLVAQFGLEMGRTRDFKPKFIRALKKVLLVYPYARVEPESDGLILLPSPPSVKRISTP